MDVSVIIVNYNVCYFLEQCILSLQKSEGIENLEIIVVDNNSIDGSSETLLKHYPDIRLVQNSKNIGFSKAVNQGVAVSKGEYVLLLNPDCFVAEDTLKEVLNFSKSRSDFGVIGVKLIDGSGGFLPECKRSVPTPKNTFKKLFGITNRHNGSYYASHISENESGEVDVLSGAFMFVKRTTFDAVSGLDEDYFMYGEDIDFCYSLLLKGYKNYFLHSSTAVHFKGESTNKDLLYLRYFHGAMKLYYKKYFRLNWYYDFMMSFGIKFWYFLKWFQFRFENRKLVSVKNVILIGGDKLIQEFLKKKFELVYCCNEIPDLEKLKQIINSKNIDTIVYDNELVSYKTTITHLEKLHGYNLNFKLHSNNTNTIIGSSEKNQQGKVLLID